MIVAADLEGWALLGYLPFVLYFIIIGTAIVHAALFWDKKRDDDGE